MALDLVQSGGVSAAAIERVEVEVSRLMHDLVGRPFAPEPEPRVAAQFSLAYTTALAFVHGEVTLAQFRPEQILQDRAVSDLAARVTVRAHDDTVFRQRMAVARLCGQDGGITGVVTDQGGLGRHAASRCRAAAI